MPTENPKFLPAFTEPPVIDVESRLRQLQEMLLDESYAFQRNNIFFVIQLYKSGQLPPAPGKDVWIMDGKIIDGAPAPEKIPKGAVLWVEGMAFQIVQTAQMPQAVAVQMGQSASYGLSALSNMHEIFASFRLVGALGGTDITLDVSIANDTGSNRQIIFTSDLAQLNYNPHIY